jgi:opacity protein-like surface antigen
MKRIFTIIMATSALTVGFNNSATAQVETGTMMIDTYYGYPNVGKSFWDALETEGAQNTETNGIGPLGTRFEYMIADNLGVGVDINYVGNGYSYEDTVQTYNETTSMWESNIYSYSYQRDKLRIMARVNYHFVITDAVDAYIGFGAGYKHKINKFTSTQPGAEEVDLGVSLLPVSARICLGTRFFFTPWLGVNLELGIGGGPLMSAGATVKF